MEAIVGILVIIGIIFGSVLYGTLAWGFVLYKFWYWFLIPSFPDIPEITFVQAMGL